MNRQVYSLCLYLLLPLVLIYFLYRGLKDFRYFNHFKERLGILKFSTLPNDGNTILIHCASLGETKAATPLIKQLFLDRKFKNIIISNTTPTGRKEVETLIRHLNKDSKNEVSLSNYYLPIDWPISCRLFLNKINPKLVVLMETELWPNLINQCKSKGIPIVLANARMSEKSSANYKKHPRLSNEIFSSISYFATQYASDKSRFTSLGVNESKITNVGSVKFNIEIDKVLKQNQLSLRQAWCKDRPCWIACSIHPGEFSSILNVHKNLLKDNPNLLLIAVPRHPEQFALFQDRVKESNLSYVNRSDKENPIIETQVVVGDTMGEIMLLCGAADVAFVGGSLIARGGHNPIEPAACGIPVIMGKSNFNFSDVSQIMQNYNALSIAKDEQSLRSILKKELTNNQNSENKEHLKKMFIENGKAIKSTSNIIYQYLE